VRLISNTWFLFYDLIVLPEYQNQGIGTSITREIIAKRQDFVSQQDEESLPIFITIVVGRDEFFKRFGFLYTGESNEMKLLLHKRSS